VCSSDLPSAAAGALGPEWATRTAAERDEFVGLFADLLERAYVGRLAGAVRATGRVSITYVAEAIDGELATVMTTLVGGKGGQVEYRMSLHDGRWQVRDIVVDGVSVVENYRAQFARVLQRDSYGAAVKAMRAKLADESLMFAALPPRAPVLPIVRAEDAPAPALPPAIVAERPKPVAAPAVAPVVPRRPAARVQPVAAVAATQPLRVVTLTALEAPELPAPASRVVASTPADPPVTSIDRSVVSLLLVLTIAGGAVYLRRMALAP